MSEIPKYINIDTKYDAVFFLNFMIVLAVKRMDRYKQLIIDIDDIIEQYKENDYIEITIGNRLLERMECLNLFLCNLYGDETKNAVSYVQFRKIIEKKIRNGCSDFVLHELSDEVKRILQELQDRRNWSHHIPQTIFTSEIEYNKDMGIDELIIRKKHTNAEIEILCYEYHKMEYLNQMSYSCKEFYKEYKKVLQAMKKDYSLLVGESVKITKKYFGQAKGIEFVQMQDNSFNRNKRKK